MIQTGYGPGQETFDQEGEGNQLATGDKDSMDDVIIGYEDEDATITPSGDGSDKDDMDMEILDDINNINTPNGDMMHLNEANVDEIDQIANTMENEQEQENDMIAHDIDQEVVTIGGYEGMDDTTNDELTLEDDLIIDEDREITTME